MEHVGSSFPCPNCHSIIHVQNPESDAPNKIQSLVRRKKRKGGWLDSLRSFRINPIYIILVFLCCASVVAYVSQSHKSTPEGIIKAYLNSDWEGRMNYVRNKEQVQSWMKEYYEGKSCEPWTPDQIVEKTKEYQLPKDWRAFEVIKEGNKITFFLESTPDGYKIDWELLRINRISADAFKASTDSNPITLRLVAELGDNYYGIRKDRDKYFAIHLTVPMENGGRGSLNGYVYRNSDDGTVIFNKLKNGQPQQAIFTVAKNTDTGDYSSVDIIKVVQWGWIPTDLSSGANQPTTNPYSLDDKCNILQSRIRDIDKQLSEVSSQKTAIENQEVESVRRTGGIGEAHVMHGQIHDLEAQETTLKEQKWDLEKQLLNIGYEEYRRTNNVK